MKLFQTLMGKKFYERDIPKLVTAVERMAVQLQRMNDAKQVKEWKGCSPEELENMGIRETYPETLRKYIDNAVRLAVREAMNERDTKA